MAKTNLLTNKYVKNVNGLDFSRSLIPLEDRHSFNGLSAYIYPTFTYDCLPGDSPDLNFGCVIQSAPLIDTCLDNIYVDVVAIFTPYRLVMTDWNEFLGESNSQAFTLNRNVTIPKITRVRNDAYYEAGTWHNISRAYLSDNFLSTHIGFRFHGDFNTSNIAADSRFKKGISVLPSRIYELNWNTFFRNENVQTPILIDKTSAVGSHDATYEYALGHVLAANTLKTWWNVATPAPSILTAEVLGPVYTGNTHGINLNTAVSYLSYDGLTATNGSTLTLANGKLFNDTDAPLALNNGEYIVPNNLWSSFTIMQLVSAYALQRYANKASKGRRAVEFYENFFGIKNSHAVYDLPQLLVQKRYPINISQVIATASGTNGTDTSDLGQRGAFSTTGFGDALIKNFMATEHGQIQVYLVIRGQPSIADGIDRHLSHDTLLDTFIPEFDHVGPFDIEQLELNSNTTGGIFGYTYAWYEYRKKRNGSVSGIMEPTEPLAYKTLALHPWSSSVVISSAAITDSPVHYDRLFQFPVCYGPTGSDLKGQPFDSSRYQWLIQFAVKGNVARVMSPQSVMSLGKGI